MVCGFGVSQLIDNNVQLPDKRARPECRRAAGMIGMCFINEAAFLSTFLLILGRCCFIWQTFLLDHIFFKGCHFAELEARVHFYQFVQDRPGQTNPVLHAFFFPLTSAFSAHVWEHKSPQASHDKLSAEGER